jgi:DNA primase
MMEHFIQTIKDKADLFRIVNQTTPLKKLGPLYKGLCPFHTEKTPSFTVDINKNVYHCFGCGAHGDVISFVQKTKQLTFMDSIQLLANELGLEMPVYQKLTDAQRKQQVVLKDQKQRLLEVHEKLTQYYEVAYQHCQEAQIYVQKRGLTPLAVQTFRLGWASQQVEPFIQWVLKEKIKIEDLKEAGILVESNDGKPGDPRLNGLKLRFRNRLMCPIFDIFDQVIAYSGRLIDPNAKTAKYLNSPETPIFTKGKSLFGLKTAKIAMREQKDKSQLILCEGNLDVVSLWQSGFHGAVAPMGTALTEEQCEMIVKLSPQQILLMMDGDQAGIKASFKALPLLLKKQLHAVNLLLPDQHDPDSYLKAFGPNRLKDQINQAEPLIYSYTRSLYDNHPKNEISLRNHIENLKALLQYIPTTDPIKSIYLKGIAKILGESETTIFSHFLPASYQKTSNPYFPKNKTQEAPKNQNKLNHETMAGFDVKKRESFTQINKIPLKGKDGLLKNSSLVDVLLNAVQLETNQKSLNDQLDQLIIYPKMRTEQGKSSEINTPQNNATFEKQEGNPQAKDPLAKPDPFAKLTDYLNNVKKPKISQKALPSSDIDRLRLILLKEDYFEEFVQLEGIQYFKDDLFRQFLTGVHGFYQHKGYSLQTAASAFFSKFAYEKDPKIISKIKDLSDCLSVSYDADMDKHISFIPQLIAQLQAERINDRRQEIRLAIKDIEEQIKKNQQSLQEKIEIDVENQSNQDETIDQYQAQFDHLAKVKQDLLREFQHLMVEYSQKIEITQHPTTTKINLQK